MPEDVVLFGVLTLLGSAMGITALLEKALRKIPPAVGAVVSVALFGLTYHAQLGYLGFGDGWVLLPRFLYQNLFTAYLGFYPEGFFSTDYFPLVPWLFLFWSGFFLHHLVGRERMEPAPFHLPSAGVAGAALAGGVSAASAGAVWSAPFWVLFARVS